MLAVVLLFVTAPNVYLAPASLLEQGPHHGRHYELLASDAPGYNSSVLKGIDRVQETAPDGGGYFVGVHAVPAESPVGYGIDLLGQPLLEPPRKTSYCSGSTYAAFIEALNDICNSKGINPSPERFEAMRMQEPDGSRREDRIKAWGWWNADGFGSDFALVQYLRMGKRVKPEDARPGDFMNISWKNGLGHSVVFLGWVKDESRGPGVLYWASQKGTNGFGDQFSLLSKIKDLCVVRLTNPKGLSTFNPSAKVDASVKGDQPPSL
jgi:hypothetical protein